jgi:molybdopterin synthase sulfur carrier subunit
MTFRLLAFATAADTLGAAESSFELPAGSCVKDLRDTLERTYPALKRLGLSLAIAVDGQIVSADTPLQEGCEVALLPPVSGG